MVARGSLHRLGLGLSLDVVEDVRQLRVVDGLQVLWVAGVSGGRRLFLAIRLANPTPDKGGEGEIQGNASGKLAEGSPPQILVSKPRNPSRSPGVLFGTGREEGLKMRTVLLARDNRHLDFAEAGFLQPLLQLHLTETQPVIGVKLARPLETMAQQIEDYEPPAFAQNAIRPGDSPFGMNRVMQRLAQDCQVHRPFFNGWIFDIAESVFEIGKAMLHGKLRAELHHLRRIIDRDDLLRRLREQLGECALARAEVGDVLRGQERDQGMRERLPGTSRHIAASEFPRQLVEIGARQVLPFPQRHFQRGAIARRLRKLARQRPRQLAYFRARGVQRIGLRQAVVDVFPRAPVDYHAGAFQLRKMTRDSRLAHAHDVLQLGDGEFLLLEEEHEPEPGGICEEPKKI